MVAVSGVTFEGMGNRSIIWRVVMLECRLKVPRRFQWYIAEGMFSLPATKYSMVIRFSVVR